MPRLLTSFFVILVSCSNGWATPAVTVGGTSAAGHGPGTFGWEFTTSQTLTVTDLGMYDVVLSGASPGGLTSGLLSDTDVGIWDVSAPGTPIVTATVLAGTASTLDGNFRFVSVTPVTLSPGVNYAIGAISDESTVNSLTSTISFAPEITYVTRRFNGSNTTQLSFPSTTDSSVIDGSLLVGDFGPNFKYAVVPEPSAALCLGCVAVLVGFRKWRSNAFATRDSSGCETFNRR